ncbi:uncharacterized protein LOC111878342 [Lactuca sativa]|uniref:uncharacterized protein LOC111878342 n=1 Tax=Lactuca sativa TaxID=4236 RepID=UPI0022AF42B2|nr:uncharacterized protein LOC111878342 [Lactuca sativa]
MKRSSPQVVGEVRNTQHLETKLLDLTNVLSQMVVGSGQQLMVCNICAMTRHYTDKCPLLSNEPEDVNAMGGYQSQPRPMRFQNNFNPNWRNNPNNPYPPKQNPPNILMRPQHPQYPSQKPPCQQTSYNPPNYQQPPQQGQSSAKAKAKANFNKRPITLSPTFKQKLETWPPLSTRWNKGENFHLKPRRTPIEEEDEVVVVKPTKVVVPPKEPVVPNIGQPESSNKTIKPLVIPPPFPSRLAFSKKIEEENKLFETFRKVQINIPLLNDIKKIPSYAKFLKDLCTKKRKFKANEKIQVNASVYAVIQKKLPPKCKDPRIFSIPFTIGDLHVESAMLDLGASINVMPYSVFQSLNVGPLEETGVIIQLADKSRVSPRGVLEDVLVQVNQLVFPVDFYVIDLEEKTPSKSSMPWKTFHAYRSHNH